MEVCDTSWVLPVLFEKKEISERNAWGKSLKRLRESATSVAILVDEGFSLIPANVGGNHGTIMSALQFKGFKVGHYQPACAWTATIRWCHARFLSLSPYLLSAQLTGPLPTEVTPCPHQRTAVKIKSKPNKNTATPQLDDTVNHCKPFRSL